MDLVKLAGIIYGDGYIRKDGAICFHHSIIQKEYALFKADKCFSLYGLKFNQYRSKLKPNCFSTNDGFVIHLHTKSWTKELRRLWYVDSKKVIPPDLLNQFSFEEWSFLYQDDGRANRLAHYKSSADGVRTRTECEPFVNRYEICLGYPSDDELNALQHSLSVLGIHSSVLNRKDGQRNISIYRVESKILFRDGITPFIHSSMRYKVNTRPALSYRQ